MDAPLLFTAFAYPFCVFLPVKILLPFLVFFLTKARSCYLSVSDHGTVPCSLSFTRGLNTNLCLRFRFLSAIKLAYVFLSPRAVSLAKGAYFNQYLTRYQSCLASPTFNADFLLPTATSFPDKFHQGFILSKIRNMHLLL